MNTSRTAIAAALLVALAIPALGQVKYGGYMAVEYIDGEADSSYTTGKVDNLLAGFLANGLLKEKYGFAIEVRARGISTFDLVQAWAGFLPSKGFTARAGLFLVPFGTWNRASRPHESLLVRTPLNLEFLYPPYWRDLGLLIEGETGVLSYAGFIGNGLAEADTLGSGQQFTDNNSDKGKGGRLGLSFGRAIRAGVSYYIGKYDDTNMYDLTLEGADLSWVTSRWEVHGEYTKAFVENPQPYERGTSEGYSIWMVMNYKSFQPIGSFQTVKYQDSYRGGIDLDKSRWTAGFRYVLSSTFFLKFEYDWNSEEGTALNNDQFQVQLGLSF